jgi:AcrR family transcriptional regulator
MSSADAPRPARQDRRKERTRTALIDAAQHLLADGADGHASIQAITDLADVGFGSFYNHFESKEDLFDAAAEAAMDEYFRYLDERLTGAADPASRLLESVRLTGQLAREHPTIAAVLGRRIAMLDNDADPRRQRIQADVYAAMAAGGPLPGTLEFTILVTATLGAILAVIRRALTLTPGETAVAADVLAQAVLRILRPGPRASPGRSPGEPHRRG